MIQIHKCPACSKPLYFYFSEFCDEDFIEGICTKCRYKYALLPTEVVEFTSSVKEDNKYLNLLLPKNKYLYQLQLLKADKTIKVVEFSKHIKSKKVSASPQDKLLLLYTMRGKSLEDLVKIENLTTVKSHLLLKPEAKAKSAGFRAGLLTLVASAVVAIGLHIPTNKLFFATAISSSIGAGVYVNKRQSIKVSDRLELRRLSCEQQLLKQKFDLEQRIVVLHCELKSNKKLVERLRSLRQKMVNAELEMYANRIETVSRAINILGKQIDLTENLIVGYRQIIEILAIEYETSRLSEQLPEDVSANILNRLDELKSIEAKKEELALLIDPQRLLREMP